MERIHEMGEVTIASKESESLYSDKPTMMNVEQPTNIGRINELSAGKMSVLCVNEKFESGYLYEVELSLLTRITGSKLAEMFMGKSDVFFDARGFVLLRTDPLVFKHVLKYIEKHRAWKPFDPISPKYLDILATEIHRLGLDIKLSDPYVLTTDIAEKFQRVLNEEPAMKHPGEYDAKMEADMKKHLAEVARKEGSEGLMYLKTNKSGEGYKASKKSMREYDSALENWRKAGPITMSELALMFKHNTVRIKNADKYIRDWCRNSLVYQQVASSSWHFCHALFWKGVTANGEIWEVACDTASRCVGRKITSKGVEMIDCLDPTRHEVYGQDGLE
jgi:hypothetical protein